MFGFKKLTDEEKAQIEKARAIEEFEKKIMDIQSRRSELKQQALETIKKLDKLLGE